jgi:MOSC domain-containing protein YiiM
MESVEQAILEAGKGLVGDRYYIATGTFSEKLEGKRDSEITLIESEEIEQFNETQGTALGYGDPRRNIVTRGVRLNDLVGHRFRVGETVLEGIRLCEPCAHLARTVTPEVLPGLVHKAGLRACVVSGGSIEPGDPVTTDSER